VIAESGLSWVRPAATETAALGVGTLPDVMLRPLATLRAGCVSVGWLDHPGSGVASPGSTDGVAVGVGVRVAVGLGLGARVGVGV
jgi:hypothetical protein